LKLSHLGSSIAPSGKRRLAEWLPGVLPFAVLLLRHFSRRLKALEKARLWDAYLDGKEDAAAARPNPARAYCPPALKHAKD